jgi:hypothetical protein
MAQTIVSRTTYVEKAAVRNKLLMNIASSHGTGIKISVGSWKDVQWVNRHGLAAKELRVGDQLQCSHDTYGTLTWDIAGFDRDRPSDPSLKHSIALKTHEPVDHAMFDAPEALYVPEEELPAGTYCFAVPVNVYEAGTEWGGGKTYQFVLTQPVPAKGQICISWGVNVHASAAKIVTYSDPTSMTPIETVPVTEGSGGTELVVGQGAHTIGRARFGNNDYTLSAIRQCINSDKEDWWKPQHDYDRPPDYAATKAGFLHGIDPEFLSVVGAVEQTIQRLAIDGGSATINDRFFLPSEAQVLGGNAYPCYAPNHSADPSRMMYYNGQPASWQLRAPNTLLTGGVRMVDMRGGGSTTWVNSVPRVVPFCCIV